MDWLNEDLKKEIKRIFEPRYNRKLSSEEVCSIASNLTSYMEHLAKFRFKLENE